VPHNSRTYWCQERLSHKTGPRIQEQLHLRNLLVHLLHELDNKVHQLVLQHLLGVEIGNEEADIISFDRFPPQDVEALGALSQEAGELVYENVLNLIGLLDLDAYPYTVDRGLNIDSLVLVAGYGERVEDDFGGAGGFNLRDIVSLGSLRGEIRQRERGGQRGAHALQVGSEGLGLRWLGQTGHGRHWRGGWAGREVPLCGELKVSSGLYIRARGFEWLWAMSCQHVALDGAWWGCWKLGSSGASERTDVKLASVHL
jgi:hypothetical protein